MPRWQDVDEWQAFMIQWWTRRGAYIWRVSPKRRATRPISCAAPRDGGGVRTHTRKNFVIASVKPLFASDIEYCGHFLSFMRRGVVQESMWYIRKGSKIKFTRLLCCIPARFGLLPGRIEMSVPSNHLMEPVLAIKYRSADRRRTARNRQIGI